jgi:predicted dehydrogenase
MNVSIIGCGLIGNKRALSLDSDDVIVACCDTNKKASEQFAKQFGCRSFDEYRALLSETKCEAVIVAVVNKFGKDIIVHSLKAGKHVLAEKPLGRNADESRAMVEQCSSRINVRSSESGSASDGSLSEGRRPILKTGFNHRFHPGIAEAMERVKRGDIGEILTLRGR